MNIIPRINQKGFTLIETLFAILIFTAALVSLMTVAGRGIAATASAREQVTAHYLAQEGLEVARNMRDANFVGNNGLWDAGLSVCVSSSCNVVYGSGTAPVLVPCSASCFVYEQNDAFVDAPGDGPSTYRRTVKLIPKTNAQSGAIDEYKIVSTVSWTSKSLERRVELSTIIKQWR